MLIDSSDAQGARLPDRIRWKADPAVLFTLLARGWLGVAGAVTAVIVGRSLTSIEQGYYYTFNSVLALQVLFEMGLAFVIIQCTSHERADAVITRHEVVVADPLVHARLASLFRLSIRWYAVASALFVVALVPVGLGFFSVRVAGVQPAHWQLAWVWLVTTTGGYVLLLPLVAFLEGAGFVADMAKMRAVQAVTASTVLWGAFAAGLGLYAAALFSTTLLAFTVAWVGLKYRRLFAALLAFDSRGSTFNWSRDVWPFQWRIAVSWLSAYLLTNFLTPLVFAMRGPVDAGRFGMTMTIANGLGSLALSWLNVKSPAMANYAARGQLRALESIFRRGAARTLAMSVGLAAIAVAGVAWLHLAQHPFAARLVTPGVFAVLMAAAVLNVAASSEALYLRAFKEEPFLVVSLATGLLTALLATLGCWQYGEAGIAAACVSVNGCVGVGMGTWVFLRRRSAHWREAGLRGEVVA